MSVLNHNMNYCENAIEILVTGHVLGYVFQDFRLGQNFKSGQFFELRSKNIFYSVQFWLNF